MIPTLTPCVWMNLKFEVSRDLILMDGFVYMKNYEHNPWKFLNILDHLEIKLECETFERFYLMGNMF